MSKNHTTHFDDCGCRSERYEKRIEELQTALRKIEPLLDSVARNVKLNQHIDKFYRDLIYLHVTEAVEIAKTVLSKVDNDLKNS